MDKTFPNSQFTSKDLNIFVGIERKAEAALLSTLKKTLLHTTTNIACKQLETILLQLRIGQRQFALVIAHTNHQLGRQ